MLTFEGRRIAWGRVVRKIKATTTRAAAIAIQPPIRIPSESEIRKPRSCRIHARDPQGIVTQTTTHTAKRTNLGGDGVRYESSIGVSLTA